MRLSGWQRIGVVITVCWVIGSFIAVRVIQYNDGLSAANAAVNLCATTGGKTFDQCWREHEDFRRTMLTPYWPPAFIIAFAPVPIFWIIGWIAIRTSRWVRAGFSPQKT